MQWRMGDICNERRFAIGHSSIQPPPTSPPFHLFYFAKNTPLRLGIGPLCPTWVSRFLFEFGAYSTRLRTHLPYSRQPGSLPLAPATERERDTRKTGLLLVVVVVVGGGGRQVEPWPHQPAWPVASVASTSAVFSTCYCVHLKFSKVFSISFRLYLK